MRKFIRSSLTQAGCILFSIFIVGCGYTTRGLINPEYVGKSIYIKPAVNNVKFTGETQEYSRFRSVPILMEDAFTKALISRFHLDGDLKIVKEAEADYMITCEMTDYTRSVLRYDIDDDDEIEEYRLKLYYHYRFYDSKGELVKEGSLISNEDYALVGIEARSEDAAIADLLDDAARRIVEKVIFVDTW